MSTSSPRRTATLEDLLAIPEGRRFHELVEGHLVEKEAASGKHGESQTRLGRNLGPYDRRAGGPPERPGGWRFASEVEIYFDAESTLRPDQAGWRRERLPEMPATVPIRVIPDWTCEILSTNRANDLVKKKRIYHRHHVAHCWILDPSRALRGRPVRGRRRRDAGNPVASRTGSRLCTRDDGDPGARISG
jgi:Uma2 family endonuclease